MHNQSSADVHKDAAANATPGRSEARANRPSSAVIVRWQAPSSATAPDRPPQDKVTLDNMTMAPGWYALDVWIQGDNALVSASARSVDARRPTLRMRLEAAGKRRFSKTLKISDSVDSIVIEAKGISARGLSRIQIKRLSVAAVGGFLMKKGIRYTLANRHRLNLPLAYEHLTAAIQSRGTFAFRERYDHQDSDKAYASWLTIHEDRCAGKQETTALDLKLGERMLRIGILVGNETNIQEAMDDVRSSLISRKIEVTPIRTAALAERSTNVENWDFILPYDRVGEFSPGAIEQLTLMLVDDPSLEGIFADSDTLQPDGRRVAPRLKPQWDRELLSSTDYVRMPLLLRWHQDMSKLFANPGYQTKPSYAVALHLMERFERQHLGRLHRILFHEYVGPNHQTNTTDREIVEANLKHLGPDVRTTSCADGIVRVEWPVRSGAHVSIIIPSKDNPELLRVCIDSIRQRTTGPSFEIIIADNGSVRAETEAFLRQVARDKAIRVIPCPGPFNFSKINNDARRHATGDVILLLNDDTRVISPNWLTELTSLALRPDIGAVGSLLLYPDGTIQHAGVLLGVSGAVADHAFRHLPGDSPGYLDLLRCRREVSAVTGACLAVSAAHFDAIGGLDETLPVTLNDIDFCLRLRERGWVNLWTPWAVLEHWESKSRGLARTNVALDRQALEVQIFAARWKDLMARDPNYHPNLSDASPDYRLAI